MQQQLFSSWRPQLYPMRLVGVWTSEKIEKNKTVPLTYVVAGECVVFVHSFFDISDGLFFRLYIYDRAPRPAPGFLRWGLSVAGAAGSATVPFPHSKTLTIICTLVLLRICTQMSSCFTSACAFLYFGAFVAQADEYCEIP